MPFTQEFNALYTSVIKPTLEHTGYEVKRADDFLDQHNIMKDIVQSITSSNLILAELTDPNPNVYYELGLAHGLRRPTVLMSQSAEALPFDLKSYRTIIYSTHFADIDNFKNKLQSVAEKALAGELSFSSPVLDYDIAEVPVGSAAPVEKPTEAPDEPGFLDAHVEFEEAASKILGGMEKIIHLIENCSAQISQHNSTLNHLQATKPANMGRQAHALTSRYAADLTKFASGVKQELPQIEEAWTVASDRGRRLTSMLVATGDSEKLASEKVAMNSVLTSIRALLASVLEAREGVAALKGASRALDKAVAEATEALDGIHSAYGIGEATIQTLLNILSQADSPPG